MQDLGVKEAQLILLGFGDISSSSFCFQNWYIQFYILANFQPTNLIYENELSVK